MCKFGAKFVPKPHHDDTGAIRVGHGVARQTDSDLSAFFEQALYFVYALLDGFKVAALLHADLGLEHFSARAQTAQGGTVVALAAPRRLCW